MAGGLRDQYAKDINDMMWAEYAYDVFKQRYEAHDVIKWIEDNEDANEFYANVKRMLSEDGNR